MQCLTLEMLKAGAMRSPGKQSHWEHALAAAHGLEWWSAAASPEWRSARRPFVDKICGLWRMRAVTLDDKPAPQKWHVASIGVPQWLPGDILWQQHARSFELRVDSSLVASWLSGTASCNTDYFQQRVTAAVDVLRELRMSDGT